ncbi:hypothetical protein ACDX78_00005 [Virgibacillus oceani]
MINSINAIPQQTIPVQENLKPEISPGEAQKKFANTLKNAIEGSHPKRSKIPPTRLNNSL